jgi:hypothetical protein
VSQAKGDASSQPRKFEDYESEFWTEYASLPLAERRAFECEVDVDYGKRCYECSVTTDDHANTCAWCVSCGVFFRVLVCFATLQRGLPHSLFLSFTCAAPTRMPRLVLTSSARRASRKRRYTMGATAHTATHAPPPNRPTQPRQEPNQALTQIKLACLC